MQVEKQLGMGSLPTRERGLKLRCSITCPASARSLPTRERGLKLILMSRVGGLVQSLPTRERGLKYPANLLFKI
ncbi:hypothetical protein [Caproicibacterium sp. XB2]|uniref:hypothetical protein n=1 Tax=Caproicibacterium sp. XB2 TaxID=3388458 RepID=UPI00384FBDCD